MDFFYICTLNRKKNLPPLIFFTVERTIFCVNNSLYIPIRAWSGGLGLINYLRRAGNIENLGTLEKLCIKHSLNCKRGLESFGVISEKNLKKIIQDSCSKEEYRPIWSITPVMLELLNVMETIKRNHELKPMSTDGLKPIKTNDLIEMQYLQPEQNSPVDLTGIEGTWYKATDDIYLNSRFINKGDQVLLNDEGRPVYIWGEIE